MEPTLSPTLASHLQALVRDPPADALDAAQAKLERRLSGVRKPTPGPARWFGAIAAAATACLVLVLVLVPTSRGVAFDVVLKHLRDFHTLDLRIEQQAQGMALPTVHVQMDRAGDARTDIGDATSVIVNVSERRALTLLHQPRIGLVIPLPAHAAVRPQDSLKWLDAIRQFQGKATELPGTRVIDGQLTRGWSLDAQGMRIAIWADADGVPRAVEVGNGQVLSQRIHVTVDPVIAPGVFSTQMPPGYREAGPDED